MLVIGEKVNATRKAVKRAVIEHDGTVIAGLVRDQEASGADYIDLNAGTGSGSQEQEIADMKWLIDLAVENSGKNLCIDSSDPEVLKAAAGHVKGKRPWMLNSIKGEATSMDALLPLAGANQVPFVALAMDEQGILRDLEGRLKVCDKIYQEVKKREIDPALIYFDPLVMPLATDCSQAVVTCDCIREIKQRFPEANTIIGLSNVSHGLPNRKAINQGFLMNALMCGLDAAIVDPTHSGINEAVLVGRALAGHDRHCLRYTRATRRAQKGNNQ